MGWEKLGSALESLRNDVQTKRRIEHRAPNPHTNVKVRNAGFFGSDVGRLLGGWETASSAIDVYLRSDLPAMRARSRQMVRLNPFGKRFIGIMKSNIVGPRGITIQAQTMMRDRTTGEMTLDVAANDAIEKAFDDWADYHCDFHGSRSFVEFQNLALASAAQDGEFIIREHFGPGAGKYAYQLEAIDAEELDITINKQTRNGGEVRLGVEYDKQGRIVRYHFARRGSTLGYSGVERYTVDARYIIHGFVEEWACQSRGVPWMHAGLERGKHLEKFDEGAIVNARIGASKMGIVYGPGSGKYEGEEEGEGEYEGDTLTEIAMGEIRDIGDRQFATFDTRYPDQMYDPFVKRFLQSIASAWGISYHALANDLEGVNYSSIRAAVLEDREIYKAIQGWFIRRFVRRSRENWLRHAMLTGNILIGNRPPMREVTEYLPAHYQGRRWAWVDPQKDGAANQQAIDNRTRSRSSIIRENGEDPETVWREIQREEALMESLGVAPITQTPAPVPSEPEEEPEK